jgi:hypothetical protein
MEGDKPKMSKDALIEERGSKKGLENGTNWNEGIRFCHVASI